MFPMFMPAAGSSTAFATTDALPQHLTCRTTLDLMLERCSMYGGMNAGIRDSPTSDYFTALPPCRNLCGDQEMEFLIASPDRPHLPILDMNVSDHFCGGSLEHVPVCESHRCRQKIRKLLPSMGVLDWTARVTNKLTLTLERHAADHHLVSSEL
ncbi:hypothetical protein DER45DRAFT_537924 [Fusarium avenaceum]|nr:hypothetical protein DER45DRAFT_537924 [Fusarium avenaceum]